MANGTARILLVDDEQSIQTLLSYPLRKDGYHVTSVLDGGEAVQRFEEGRFDLVILDLMLPRVSGFEVLSAIRADPLLRETPVVVLTAWTHVSATEEVADADRFVPKPFEPEELASVVRELLGEA